MEQQLIALRLTGAHGDALFVPFKDTTNDPDTYGAGRYLDLELTSDGAHEPVAQPTEVADSCA